MIKTKTWILIFSVLLLLSLGVSGFLYLQKPESQIVEILQGGKCIKTIDLSTVTSPYRFVIEDEKGGSNTVLVKDGRICIVEADCPDQICVKQGWLADSAAPIVCLPHQLVLQFAEESELDAVAQ